MSIAYWSMGSGGLPLIIGSPLVFGHLTRERVRPEGVDDAVRLHEVRWRD